MPAIMTHYAFARMRIPHHKELDVLTLGSQGPDVFFFYGYNIKKRPNIKQVRDFGTLLHRVDISKPYYFLLQYAKKQSDEEREVLEAFIYGLFLHYILDRNCHPYVFYRTGFTYSNDKKENQYYFGAHASFEAYIDTLIKERFSIKIPHRKAIVAPKNKVKLISKMMHELAKEVFEDDVIDEETYYLAWEDMKFLQVIFYSPLGAKKGIMRAFSAQSSLNAMISPHIVRHNHLLDVLNDQKSEWRDCITNEVRNESFLELFAKADEDVTKLENILKGNYQEEDLKVFVNNIDHDGFPLKEKKIHFDNVWAKHPHLKW